MASTLTPTTFHIKIKEEHIVKGIKTLNETFFTLKDITNIVLYSLSSSLDVEYVVVNTDNA